MDVLVKEINQKFLDGGLERIKANLGSSVKKGKITAQQAEAVMRRVTGTLTYDDFRSVDIVIEAAIEDIKLKQQIFADLEKACKAQAILSSNTSTIDIEVVGGKTHALDRIIGAHFFSPAHIMPLLEIVRTPKTDPQVVLDLLEMATKIKKTPVVVGNCTGFAVNRVFFPYTQAACMLVDLGLNPYLVDKAIAGFGMPMGPFRLSDLVGADIGLHVGKNFADSFPARVYPASVILLLNREKKLGEKTGSGFYTYDKKRKASPNPELAPLVEEARRNAGLLKDGAKPPQMSAQVRALLRSWCQKSLCGVLC
jgi:enoyl-CoA hydratase/3-hydroxyacyl-CoA dehydrogenase